MTVTRTRISNNYVKPSQGTTTRTRISGDYVKGNSSQARTNATYVGTYGGTTTRERISGHYVKPSYQTTYSILPRPAYFASPVYVPSVYVPPVEVVHTPRVVVRNSSESSGSATGAVLAVALVIAVVALVVLSPSCYDEEVCVATTVLGEKICHLERVCTS